MARMNVLILEDRGIYKKGDEVEMARAQGEQWINSEFAEYVPPVAKPKAKPKADPKDGPKAGPEPKAKAKPKAKKEEDKQDE